MRKGSRLQHHFGRRGAAACIKNITECPWRRPFAAASLLPRRSPAAAAGTAVLPLPSSMSCMNRGYTVAAQSRQAGGIAVSSIDPANVWRCRLTSRNTTGMRCDAHTLVGSNALRCVHGAGRERRCSQRPRAEHARPDELIVRKAAERCYHFGVDSDSCPYRSLPAWVLGISDHHSETP